MGNNYNGPAIMPILLYSIGFPILRQDMIEIKYIYGIGGQACRSTVAKDKNEIFTLEDADRS